MFTHISSMHFLHITILIIILLLPSSNGVDDRYKTCTTSFFFCGNTVSNVGYPFWGDGRPQYCGNPALQLQCRENNDYPILIIGGLENETSNHVLNLKISHQTTIFQFQAIQGSQNIPCPFDFKGLSEFFKLSASSEFITLLYNCPTIIPMNYLNSSIPCLASSTQYQAYYVHNMSAREGYASCSSTQVPVLSKQLDRYNQGIGSLFDVLYQGFEMNYEYSSECIKCNNTGGICGSSSDFHFVCFCSDGTSGNVCRKSESRILIIAGSASFGVGVGMLIGLLYCLRKRRSAGKFAVFWKSEAAKCPNVDAFLQIYGSFSLTRYTHANIKKMTNGFKDKLGEGGYAIVYKGQLFNGCLVAVKVLKQSKGDGEDFLNEVASISRTNHVNIVCLLGFCFEGNKRALIYEFLPNGSLEKFTYHGGSPSNHSLPWDTLRNISIGIARGLDYLHRGCNARIVHFDIKPHNILLDEEFCPKISDFGLAKLCPLQESTISMMEARGTIGYIAPEVFCRTIGGVSHKYDVYSFGMMILDMVCGRKNLSADLKISSELYFPKWIYDRLELEKEDAFQGTTCDEEKVVQKKMILVSLWCIQTYPSNRPSMSRVVDMLQGDLESLEIPPQPNLSSPPRLALDTSGTLTVVAVTSD